MPLGWIWKQSAIVSKPFQCPYNNGAVTSTSHPYRKEGLLTGFKVSQLSPKLGVSVSRTTKLRIPAVLVLTEFIWGAFHLEEKRRGRTPGKWVREDKSLAWCLPCAWSDEGSETLERAGSEPNAAGLHSSETLWHARPKKGSCSPSTTQHGLHSISTIAPWSAH